jgi:hypothetical protein
MTIEVDAVTRRIRGLLEPHLITYAIEYGGYDKIPIDILKRIIIPLFAAMVIEDAIMGLETEA